MVKRGVTLKIGYTRKDICSMIKTRADELLKACQELLMKQQNSFYVLNLLDETVFYDESECDGNCLLEDINTYFEIGE